MIINGRSPVSELEENSLAVVAISAASFCDACYLIEVGVPGAMAVMDQLEAFPIWNSIRVKEVGGSKKEYTSQGALRAYGRYDELQLFRSGSEAIRGEPVISERPVGLELVKKVTQFSSNARVLHLSPV